MTTANLQELKHHTQLLSDINARGDEFDSPLHQLVMLTLANHFHLKKQVAFPSIGTIAKLIKRSKRTVQYVLSDLKEDGWLTIFARFEGEKGDKNRRQTTNGYVIKLKKLGRKISSFGKKQQQTLKRNARAWQQEKKNRDAKTKAEHEYRQSQGKAFDAMYDSMKDNAVSSEDGLSYVDSIKSKLFGKKPK